MSRRKRHGGVAYDDDGDDIENSPIFTRRFLVSFSATLSEIEQGGINGMVWQPTHVDRVFGGNTTYLYDDDEAVSSKVSPSLENVYLRKITLLNYRSTFPVSIGVKFTDPDSNMHGIEATGDGQRFAHITLARSESNTPDVIYTETTSDETELWRKKYPRYNRNNLMNEGVMKLQNGMGFRFVNQNPPAVDVILNSKETLSEDCRNMNKIDGEFYKITNKGLQHACELLISKVLNKVSNTNLNDFSITLVPVLDTSSTWDTIVTCERFQRDVVSNCTQNYSEHRTIMNKPLGEIINEFMMMRFHWSARYEIEYAIPSSQTTDAGAKSTAH